MVVRRDAVGAGRSGSPQLSLPSSGAFGGSVTLRGATIPAQTTLTETLTNIARRQFPRCKRLRERVDARSNPSRPAHKCSTPN
jgi:hypothetical protein